ncbi:MAG: hypothetical protein HY074_14295 [Deltaproteobacteria bacterium]|nr:hypothetical protein [Deltaproteobacteria bacterium]
MSFNYLEIARATQELAASLPDEVQAIELVRFPLGRGIVPDLNVGLRLKNSRKMVVFSLKQPWTGLYVVAPSNFSPFGAKGTKPSWAGAFSGSEQPAQEWDSYIRGQILERAQVAEGERIVKLSFANGTELRIELIPSRPNWVLVAGGAEIRWRSSLPPRPGGGGLSSGVSLREFAGEGPWMQRAYEHYLELRRTALVQAQLQGALSELQARLTRLIKIRGQMEESLSESTQADGLQLQAEAVHGCRKRDANVRALQETAAHEKRSRGPLWRHRGREQADHGNHSAAARFPGRHGRS